jgi:predicted dienelactone hydrolase
MKLDYVPVCLLKPQALAITVHALRPLGRTLEEAAPNWLLTSFAGRRQTMTARNLILALLLVGVVGKVNTVRGQTDKDQVGGSTTTTPKLPLPSGPFGIGRTDREWIDSSRPDAYSSNPDAHRHLMVYLWYPAPPKYKEKTGPYLPGARQMDANAEVQQMVGDAFGSSWRLIVSGAIVSHAVENAPVAKSPSRFPVVLFSHGLGSMGFAYTSLIEDLVSHGYVVASIEHTYTAMAVVFPNGQVVPFHQEPEPLGLTPEQRFKRMEVIAGIQIREGAGDLMFVLNKLSEMNGQKVQQFPLGGRLDIERVAAMGHSSGGAFATLACQMDQRFKACISLDGALPPVAAFPEYGKGFTQPVLLLEIDHTGQRRGFDAAQEVEYMKKKEAQLNACPIGSYDIVLKSPGLIHGSFSDVPLLFANGNRAKIEDALYNLRSTQAFARSFLDKYLKHAADRLVNDASEYPGTIVTPYGH